MTTQAVNPVDLTTKPKPAPKRSDFDPQLQWLLLFAGADAMRERGTLGAFVNVMELGGPTQGGVPNTDLYTEKQIGWAQFTEGDVETYRFLCGAWYRLTHASKSILAARYVKPRAEFRGDAGFGARDHCPDHESGDNGPAYGSHPPTHTGVESRLGELASLACWLVQDPARLVVACADPSRGDGAKRIREALRVATKANSEAHAEWWELKTGKPRRRKDRVSMQPVHVPVTE